MSRVGADGVQLVMLGEAWLEGITIGRVVCRGIGWVSDSGVELVGGPYVRSMGLCGMVWQGSECEGGVVDYVVTRGT